MKLKDLNQISSIKAFITISNNLVFQDLNGLHIVINQNTKEIELNKGAHTYACLIDDYGINNVVTFTKNTEQFKQVHIFALLELNRRKNLDIENVDKLNYLQERLTDCYNENERLKKFFESAFKHTENTNELLKSKFKNTFDYNIN